MVSLKFDLLLLIADGIYQNLILKCKSIINYFEMNVLQRIQRLGALKTLPFWKGEA